MTLTRIIDCVSTWSAENFESSSDPSRRTVNAPCPCRFAGVGVGDEADALLGDGVGDAMLTTCPVASQASLAAGRKYARLPAIAEMNTAKTARTAVRVILRRLREALARRPGLIPSGTGEQSSAKAGTSL
jgi:hypothetical protein